VSRPTWLPEMLRTDGDPKQVFSALYKMFEASFKQQRCTFQGLPVFWDRRVLEGEYEEGFWHVITKTDQGTGERLFDPRRAERLSWCGPLLHNAHDNAVKVWDWRDGKGRIRTHIWLEEWDYVIILEKRRDGRAALLITAYYVEGERTRKQLQSKYNNREAKNAIAATKDGERSPSTHGR